MIVEVAPGHQLHRGWYTRQPGWRLTAEFLIRTVTGWSQPTVRLFGHTHLTPRLVIAYGSAYSYSGIRHADTPIPDAFVPLLERASALCGVTFNSILVNLYRDGQDAIGWHSDDEPELGDEPVIASLSLGGTRTFKVRGRDRVKPTASVVLLDGDLLVMSGRSQADYVHSVPRTRRPVQPRINVTLRVVR